MTKSMCVCASCEQEYEADPTPWHAAYVGKAKEWFDVRLCRAVALFFLFIFFKRRKLNV
jgi:hypothetical protein